MLQVLYMFLGTLMLLNSQLWFQDHVVQVATKEKKLIKHVG